MYYNLLNIFVFLINKNIIKYRKYSIRFHAINSIPNYVNAQANPLHICIYCQSTYSVKNHSPPHVNWNCKLQRICARDRHQTIYPLPLRMGIVYLSISILMLSTFIALRRVYMTLRLVGALEICKHKHIQT